MDADIVDLKEVVRLGKKYKAVIFLDDCHGAGILGKTGRGTPEYRGVDIKDIDAYVSTMGKGLSGGGGGYLAGSNALITWIKQRSRTYIFSNALSPLIVNCARLAIKILSEDPTICERRIKMAKRFRKGMRAEGFTILGDDDCSICPVLLKDAYMGRKIELMLLDKGIYTIGIGYPVVAVGTARMRIIITSKHTEEQIDGLVKAYADICQEVNYWEYMKGNKELLQRNLRNYAIKEWLKSWFVPRDM